VQENLAFSENKSTASWECTGTCNSHKKLGTPCDMGVTNEGKEAPYFQKLSQAEWNYPINSLGTKDINTARRQTVKPFLQLMI
jgi:hypothetical protein